MKLTSMTAFGAASERAGDFTYTCEVRTLNARYLEVNVRLPRQLMAFEVELINEVKKSLRRGKVDVFVEMAREGASKDLPEVNIEAARHYAAQLLSLNKLMQAQGLGSGNMTLGLSELLRLDGLLSDKRPRAFEGDAVLQHRPALLALLHKALDKVIAARSQEGQALGEALRRLLDELRAGVQIIDAQRPLIEEQTRKTYLKRLTQVLGLVQKAAADSEASQREASSRVGTPAVEEHRLFAEIAILLDKADIEEELTRMRSHLDTFYGLLQGEEAPGRKLDFLCQEMHREVNTISNKLVQIEVSKHTIEMKQGIERIRQQVQNLE